MAEEKELDFFYDPACLERLDEYASFFDGDASLRGESSPRYTYAPRLPGVPERIRAAIPDVKLIYVVRDPVERALSHHMYYSAVWEELPLEEAFADVEDPYHLYAGPSRYAYQLELYLEVFPRDQIMVVDQADLLADGTATMSAVFRFLGVHTEPDSRSFNQLINPGSDRRRMVGPGRWLRASPLARAVGYLPQRPREMLLRAARRTMLRRATPPPRPSPALRERLQAAFADDAMRLRELTGLEFPSWQV
jgi:Sulfotransferase family